MLTSGRRGSRFPSGSIFSITFPPKPTPGGHLRLHHIHCSGYGISCMVYHAGSIWWAGCCAASLLANNTATLCIFRRPRSLSRSPFPIMPHSQHHGAHHQPRNQLTINHIEQPSTQNHKKCTHPPWGITRQAIPFTAQILTIGAAPKQRLSFLLFSHTPLCPIHSTMGHTTKHTTN